MPAGFNIFSLLVLERMVDWFISVKYSLLVATISDSVGCKMHYFNYFAILKAF